MKLHEVTHGSYVNHYCGPAALSILTGFTAEQCAAVIRQEADVAKVQRVHTSVMLLAMREMNIKFKSRYDLVKEDGKLKTLAKFFRSRPSEDRGKTFLLACGLSNRHYMVVRASKVADNHTKGPVWLRLCPKRRRRVIDCWQVWGDPVLPAYARG